LDVKYSRTYDILAGLAAKEVTVKGILRSDRPARNPILSMSLFLLFFLSLASHAPAGTLPGIDQEILVDEWHYLGPFSAGAREGIPSQGPDPASLDPGLAGPYPSVMIQGGFVEWKTTAPDSTGWVSTDFENVRWDTLMDIYGYAGIVNSAYAFAEFEVPCAARALVRAQRMGSFDLNGRTYPGDPYAHGYMLTPVLLQKGINRVVIRLTGYGDHRFKFEVIPPPSPLIILDDYTAPDLIAGGTAGDQEKLWLGIPVLNTTDEWIHGAGLQIGDGAAVAYRDAAVGSIAPLCVKKIPVKIAAPAREDSSLECSVPVRVIHDGLAFADTLTLRVRGPGESVKRTFISSIDSSCQYYAMMAPTGHERCDRQPAGREPGDREPVVGESYRWKYPLIYTLHGAGVKAEGQVDAYRAKPRTYIVAPTNRRPFGFDWQDWGRLDALEVLDEVKRALPVDPNRVYLTGHSMGGHGVWHVGLAHPDLFAAMAPGAGWTSFDLYVPWFLQKAYVFGDPEVRAIRGRALLQDAPHRYVENARNLPVFILQGGSDDNVPPYHPRLFVQRLEQLGYEYKYKEDPGRGHWWGIDSLDISCVDDPDLIGFFPGKYRERFPRHVTFKTANIACCDRAYWVEMRAQDIPYRDSWIDAKVHGDTVKIEIENVRSLAVTLTRQLFPGGRATVLLAGKSFKVEFKDRRVLVFSRRAGEFMEGEAEPYGLVKTAGLYGPIKQAMFSPFVLVYGTRGDAEMTGLLLHQARLTAFQWWRRANGLAEIMPDTLVTPALMARRNLVLFGGPEENSIVSRIGRALPIRRIKDTIYLGNERIAGEGIASCLVYPNPLSPEKLIAVHMGSDQEGQELSTFFRTVYSGSGLPDFVIFDSTVRSLGWGGMIAAGFFDSRWQPDRDLCYFKYGWKGNRQGH
jgi:dienelactone hydrolase